MGDDFRIPTLGEVFEEMDQIFRVIDMLDSSYRIFEGNLLMRYYQNRDITLRTIFLRDILEWLCFLGWADGNIDSNEIKFINALLELNLNQLDIFEIVKNLDPERLSILPLSFAIFLEHELISDMDNDQSIVDALSAFFFITGSYLITCDGHVDDNEVGGLMLYMETLRRNIATFDLASLHKTMLNNI